MSEPRLALDFPTLWEVRQYVEDEWFAPGDKTMIAKTDPPWEVREAFTGRKYGDYGGYGYALKPRHFLEIGVAAGYSSAAILKGAQMNDHQIEKVVLMDIHPDLIKTLNHLGREFHRVEFIAEVLDSQTFKGYEFAEAQRPEGGYDIVHIDGDHTFDGALHDITTYAPMVAPNGLVIVDDARDPNIERACRIYQELEGLRSAFVPNFNGHILLAR